MMQAIMPFDNFLQHQTGMHMLFSYQHPQPPAIRLNNQQAPNISYITPQSPIIPHIIHLNNQLAPIMSPINQQAQTFPFIHDVNLHKKGMPKTELCQNWERFSACSFG